jgi:hypothetical protein
LFTDDAELVSTMLSSYTPRGEEQKPDGSVYTEREMRGWLALAIAIIGLLGCIATIVGVGYTRHRVDFRSASIDKV